VDSLLRPALAVDVQSPAGGLGDRQRERVRTAIEAAWAALSGRARGAAKSRDGNVEAIRALVVAKRSARSTRIQALNQIRHVSFTAPDELRQRLAGVSRQQLAAKAAALRPGRMREGAGQAMPATKTALRILGRRVLALDEEKARIDAYE
jgi:transposase